MDWTYCLSSWYPHTSAKQCCVRSVQSALSPRGHYSPRPTPSSGTDFYLFDYCLAVVIGTVAITSLDESFHMVLHFYDYMLPIVVYIISTRKLWRRPKLLPILGYQPIEVLYHQLSPRLAVSNPTSFELHDPSSNILTFGLSSDLNVRKPVYKDVAEHGAVHGPLPKKGLCI